MRISLTTVIALLLAFPWGNAQAALRQPITVQTLGGHLLVECFSGSTNASLPTVLILSGSKGFGSPAYGEIGQTFLDAGLQACLVHFLTPADLSAIDSAGSSEARERYYAKRQAAWIAGIEGVVSYFNALPAHAGKVGLLGISLGAEMATAVSADRSDIGALVIVDGSFPDGYSQPVHSLPPLYLIWGSEDRTFPLAVGLNLQHMAQHLGRATSIDVYKGGPHNFFLLPGTPQAQAAHLSAARFLLSQLSGSDRSDKK
jgi:dienelactone hydrolase